MTQKADNKDFRKSKLKVSIIRDVSWTKLGLCCPLELMSGILRGEERGGMDWEIRTVIYTLLCIK